VRFVARGIGLLLLFSYYLIHEWLRGPPAQDPYEDQQEEEPEDDQSQNAANSPARDPYADALALFGLSPGFTQSDLARAYIKAIKTAHPDAGGSLEKAQAVNVARDAIELRHGWA
jgi:hypothetical protein